MEKKYIIDRSDRRSFYAFVQLKNEGKNVFDFDETTSYDSDCVFVFSPSKRLTENILNKIPPGSTVFCNTSADGDGYSHIRFVNLSRQEKYRRINSQLTAEGALSLTISSTEKALFDSSVLILGYGNLGSALCETFLPHCKRLTVTAFTLAEMSDAGQKYQTYFKKEFVPHLKEYDVIINTVPHNILSRKDVYEISENALYLELASKPYGVDPADGVAMKAKYVLGNALPDKYSAKTAGDALAACVDHVLEDGKQ